MASEHSGGGAAAGAASTTTSSSLSESPALEVESVPPSSGSIFETAQLLAGAFHVPKPAAAGSKHLSLPEDVKVEVVDTASGAVAALRYLRQHAQGVVGIDTEWKPGTTNPTAVLQLSTRSLVYLFDLLSLSKERNFWHTEFTTLMTSKTIVKVGFAVEGDLRRLATCSGLAVAAKSINAVVELAELYHATSPANTVPPGLTQLVRRVLRATLDKTCQVSDWEQRPLSAAQIQYAAIDAHICVQLYDAMVARLPVGVTTPQFSFMAFDNTSMPSELGALLVRRGITSQDGAYISGHRVLHSTDDAKRFLIGRKLEHNADVSLDDRLIKSVALAVTRPDGTQLPVVVVTIAPNMIDTPAVTALLVERGEAADCTVKMASRKQCVGWLNQEPGCITPFELGWSTLPLLILDTAVSDGTPSDALYCGVGEPNALLQLSRENVCKLADFVCCAVSARKQSSPADSGAPAATSVATTAAPAPAGPLEWSIEYSGWGRRIAVPMPGGGDAPSAQPAACLTSGVLHGNAAVFVQLAELLHEFSLSDNPRAVGMWQYHLALRQARSPVLPTLSTLVADYCTHTQLFLCNNAGNLCLRVLRFVTESTDQVPNLSTLAGAQDTDSQFTWLQTAYPAFMQRWPLMTKLVEQVATLVASGGDWRVGPDAKSLPLINTSTEQLLALTELLHEIVRVGNGFVQSSVGAWTKHRIGTEDSVHAVMAIAFAFIECAALVLYRLMPWYGAQLLQQLGYGTQDGPTIPQLLEHVGRRDLLLHANAVAGRKVAVAEITPLFTWLSKPVRTSMMSWAASFS